jgi:hypothetical protein
MGLLADAFSGPHFRKTFVGSPGTVMIVAVAKYGANVGKAF